MAGMKIGYVHGANDEQHQALQMDVLQQYGCERIVKEQVSSAPGLPAGKHRSQLEQLMRSLQAGDELVVWDLDCLGITTRQLILLMDRLYAGGVGFKCLMQPLLDTTAPQGQFLFQLFALLAQHERKRLTGQTRVGLAAARARGRNGGRPRGLSPHYQSIAPSVVSAYQQGDSIREIQQAFAIPSSATVYKILSAFQVPVTPYLKSDPTPFP